MTRLQTISLTILAGLLLVSANVGAQQLGTCPALSYQSPTETLKPLYSYQTVTAPTVMMPLVIAPVAIHSQPVPVIELVSATVALTKYAPAEIVFDGPMVNFEDQSWYVYTEIIPQASPAIKLSITQRLLKRLKFWH